MSSRRSTGRGGSTPLPILGASAHPAPGPKTWQRCIIVELISPEVEAVRSSSRDCSAEVGYQDKVATLVTTSTFISKTPFMMILSGVRLDDWCSSEKDLTKTTSDLIARRAVGNQTHTVTTTGTRLHCIVIGQQSCAHECPRPRRYSYIIVSGSSEDDRHETRRVW